jgi:hypothetical protein
MARAECERVSLAGLSGKLLREQQNALWSTNPRLELKLLMYFPEMPAKKHGIAASESWTEQIV